jgi:hypothetical protein
MEDLCEESIENMLIKIRELNDMNSKLNEKAVNDYYDDVEKLVKKYNFLWEK